MSASQVRAAVEEAFRDFATSGVPASGEHDPDKAEIRAALGSLLEATLVSIGSGFNRYATVALMEADTNETDGTLAYVYDNAGDPGDAGNGIYQWNDGGSAWEPAEWYFDAVATALGTRVAQARALISGTATVNVDDTIDLSIGYLWVQDNSGNPSESIAAVVDGAALAAGTGYIVDFDTGSVDGSGRYIPEMVTIASGLQTGWQDRNRYVLLAIDSAGTYFGEYAREAGGFSEDEVVAVRSGTAISVYSPISPTRAALMIFSRVTDAGTRSDVWRLERVWLSARTGATTFSALVPFTDEGETEIAVALTGGTDHMGGTSHGDHEAVYAQLMMDGQPFDGDGTRVGKLFEILMHSELTDPDDGAHPVVAKLDSRHVVKPGGVLEYIPTLEWLSVESVNQLNLGMIKPALTYAAADVFDAAYYDDPWQAFDLTGALVLTQTQGRALKYSSSTQDIFITVEQLELGDWDRPNRFVYIATVSPKGKGYFDFTGAAYNTAVAERFTARIRYTFGMAA